MKNKKDIENLKIEKNALKDIDKEEKLKLWLLDLGISAGVLIVLAVLTAVIIIFFNANYEFDKYPITCFVDIMTIPGILGIFGWLLIFVSNEGVFDLIVYGTKKFLSFVFRLHPEDSKLPKTYGDYYVMKHTGKKPNRHWGILIVGALFFLTGLILLIPSYLIEGGIHHSDPGGSVTTTEVIIKSLIIGGF